MAESNPFTKAQTIDPEVKAYVTNLVTALGGSSADDDGHYALGDDALLVLRDLKRWLKLYDEKTNRLDVARCLAEADLIRGDLLPILSLWSEGEKDKRKEKLFSRLALSCLELLVPLTWPIELEEMTANHHRHAPYIQQAQVKYKAATLHWDHASVLRQAVRIALPSISLKKEERESRDEGVIKLMLYFLRNIASIRQIPNLPSQGLENEVSRSATILAFRDQDVFALLLMICSNMGDDFNLEDVVVLEILFNLVKGVDVQRLWMTQDQQRGQNISELETTLTIEDSMQREAKKKEWSRHGRFGTMIWMKREDEKMTAVSGQDNLKSSKTALFNIDNTKKWIKPQQRRKDLDHNSQDFDRAEDLSPQATDCLRNFVQELLDSGFNPLFTHLRKAIEREAERLLPVNYRQFFYVVSWFLQAERVRRERQKNDKTSAQADKDFEAESYALVAAVLNQETFITLNRYMQMSLDDKSWQDLNASMRCFTQILLTVQDMAQSSLEEDREIAENIQNRIFYEETTHDRVRALLAGYKDQGLGYLDAVTELSHVFLRMLERYSKENTNLQIRSKRKANRKHKEPAQQVDPDANVEEHNPDLDEEEEEEIREAAQLSRERKFDFNRFAAKFTNQSTINTFSTFLRYYKDLNMDQLKRAHRFFHRAAFKQDMAILLYRVDIIALFYRIIEGPEGLDKKHAMYFDWHELTKQLFRKLFKKLDQRPELMIEMLFSKIPSTLYYLEYGHDKQNPSSLRAPTELEVKPAPGRDRKEQIGIVVTVLLNDGQFELVDFVKRNLTKAFDERHAWEAEAEARNALAQDEAQRDQHTDSNKPPAATTEQSSTQLAPAQPSYITIQPSSDAIRIALHKNARLILFMSLVGFEPQFSAADPDHITTSIYTVPSTLTTAHLSDSLNAISQHMQQPWTGLDEDDTPESQLRRARKQLSQLSNYLGAGEEGDARRDNFIDDDEGSDALPSDNEFLFPDNPRAKPKSKTLLEQLKEKRRKRKRSADSDAENEDEQIDEDLAAERRRKREQNALARRRKIKSDLFVHDSDDESDREKDEDFFRREEELRLRQNERVKEQMELYQAAAEENARDKTKKRKSLGGKGRAGKQNKRRKTTDSDAEQSNSSSDEGEGDVSVRGSSPAPNDDLELSSPPQSSARNNRARSLSSDAGEDDTGEETPTTSPLASSPAKANKTQRNILQELKQGRSSARTTDSKISELLMRDQTDVSAEDVPREIEDENDQDDVVVTTHRRRGGFVIDDDDDE